MAIRHGVMERSLILLQESGERMMGSQWSCFALRSPTGRLLCVADKQLW